LRDKNTQQAIYNMLPDTRDSGRPQNEDLPFD